MTDQDPLYLTKYEIEELVAKGVESGINRALRDLGLPSSHDNYETIKRFRSNQQFLDDWRELCELVKHKGVATAILMVMTALGTVIVLGFKGWIWN